MPKPLPPPPKPLPNPAEAEVGTSAVLARAATAARTTRDLVMVNLLLGWKFARPE